MRPRPDRPDPDESDDTPETESATDTVNGWTPAEIARYHRCFPDDD